ncbi:MAG TPA: hypothetical protein VHE35_31780 [Kofleriaceae bacterium]|nr:hypothetical protein [Kofleriaceae bacterium]
MSADDYPSARAAALAALHAGDAEGAFRALRGPLSHPRLVPVAELEDALGVLGPIFAALGARALAERVAEASLAPTDPERLYALGYQLIEDGVAAVAVTVLARGVELSPDSEALVTELVAALEVQLAYRDAANVLAVRPALVESSFLCRYLLVFDSIMSGDLATARDTVPRLVPAEHAQERMATRVQAMLARADRASQLCPLDGHDLRGWHHVITGGLLLHRSPYGLDAGMHGRYAWLQDSWAMVRHGLERLRAVLDAWGWQPPCVYAPPGREHEALAVAAATLLGVPQAPWPAVGAPAPGLVVAYDLATVAPRELERLAQRRRDQVLHAHVTIWTEDGPVAPEVTTLLAQSVVAPWGRRLAIDAESRTTKAIAEDPRDAEALAADIVAAPPAHDDDVTADDEPGLLALARLAGLPAPGPRERSWAGSPVASNRFL